MFNYLTSDRKHEIVKVNNEWIIVDTCNTFDAGYETAIAKIDYDKFAEMWLEESDSDKDILPTDEDIAEWAEELLSDDLYWKVVQNYRTRKSAFTHHEKWCGRKK